MAVNTANLESYTVFSSVSLNGSGATLAANTVSTSTAIFTNLVGSGFTVGSSATTGGLADGAFQFSVLSLTTNGATIRYRSGATIYTFVSVAN